MIYSRDLEASEQPTRDYDSMYDTDERIAGQPSL